jgi:hypothetical protein
MSPLVFAVANSFSASRSFTTQNKAEMGKEEGMQGAAVSCQKMAKMGGGERRGWRELPLATRKWQKWGEGNVGATASYR